MGRELDKFEIEACTKAAYENHRIFCEAMGDQSHVPWEFLHDDLKAVARHATVGIATHDHNAERSHQAWVDLKRSQGWNFGQKKSEQDKTHPCLVEWRDLPFEQQAKDELWIQSVKNLLNAFWRIPRQ